MLTWIVFMWLFQSKCQLSDHTLCIAFQSFFDWTRYRWFFGQLWLIPKPILCVIYFFSPIKHMIITDNNSHMHFFCFFLISVHLENVLPDALALCVPTHIGQGAIKAPPDFGTLNTVPEWHIPTRLWVSERLEWSRACFASGNFQVS